ncbi:MAG: hypothetical protein AB1698_19280, partial [Pseudomonadota bacterium]
IPNAMTDLEFFPGGLVSICTLQGDGYHRETRQPGADLSDLPDDVRAEIEAVWTPEVVAAWQASQVPPAPTKAHVYAERDRRLAMGFSYDFGDGRGVHRFGTTDADKRGWDEVSELADVLRRTGSSAGITIATETGPARITPAEWDAILLASAAMRQPIWQASFLLTALDPIPADYADDVHWPPAA